MDRLPDETRLYARWESVPPALLTPPPDPLAPPPAASAPPRPATDARDRARPWRRLGARLRGLIRRRSPQKPFPPS